MTITIGQRLDQLRTDLDIPRAEIAKQLGVGETIVSEWGAGHGNPNLAHTAAYARLVRWRLIATLNGKVIAEGEALADLVSLREEVDLSRAELAERLGIIPARVSERERRAKPSMWLAPCQKYLRACGYKVGLAPAAVPRG